MVRFRSGPTEQGRAHRPPPPNYFARSTQIRLLMIVGALMLALYLTWEARKPENWAWMWAGVRQPQPATSADPTDDTVNTRLPPTSPAEEGVNGTVFADSPVTRDDEFEEEVPKGNALLRTRLNAWSRLTGDWERSDRTLLAKVLKSSRDQSPLGEEDRQRWAFVLENLSQQWDAFHAQATQAVDDAGDDMPASEKELWQQILQDVNQEWSEHIRVALQAPLDARPWTERERFTLARLQETLDELALNAVHDDTVWRGAEQYAWFRLIEKLQNTNGEGTAAAPETPIGFLALFRQPDAYRGKLVRFRGTATLAYRVQAPENVQGIENYFVFWLRPEGGPNSPLVVYALEAPPGFPEIKDKDLDQTTTRLEEDFEVVGYFFKRWAYRAQDGLNTAPVLLTKCPRWLSAPTEARSREPPPWASVVISVLAVAVLAIGLAGLAYWSNRSNPAIQRFVDDAERRANAPPVPDDAPPGVQESLQRLADGDTGDE
ncbi:MAG: hypothetical protein ACC628_00815 [Pirellulaceae bacterium]